MSAEKLVEALGKRVDRRAFLVKVGKGVVGGLLGLMGLPQSAAAVGWKCCTLCENNSGSCSGCACQWCWTCYYAPENKCYKCCECHTDTSYCGRGCGNVDCSWAYEVPLPCPLAPVPAG